MLAHRQDRARKRARRFLELLTELFVVVLVLPALLVIAATALTVVVPELLSRSTTPVGVVPTRAVVLYGAVVVFLVAIGLVGAVAVGTLRPPNQRASYDLPAFPAKSSPRLGRAQSVERRSSARAPPAALLAVGLAFAGYTLVNVALLSYAAFAVPVGAVAGDAPGRREGPRAGTSSTPSRDTSRRAPFPAAVEAVARDVDLGVLDDDVADLAFALRSTTATGVRGVRSVRETRGVRVRRHSRPASARPRSIGLSSASERRWPRGHSGSSPTP